MKKIGTYLVALFVLLQFSAQAQIRTERKTMSEGVYEAMVLQIPGLTPKDVGSMWTDFTKDFYSTRSKYNRKTKEYFSDDAEIPGIGKGNTVDIYTSISETQNGSELSMWINLGGAYMSAAEHGDRHLEAEGMLMRFALEASKEVVRREIKAQEKDLDDLMGDLKKMGNEKERMERDIEKAKAAIAEAEQGIEQNLAAQQAKQEEIDAQGELINETKKKLNDL